MAAEISCPDTRDRSLKVTRMIAASWMTCLLVTMMPLGSMTKPEPTNVSKCALGGLPGIGESLLTALTAVMLMIADNALFATASTSHPSGVAARATGPAREAAAAVAAASNRLLHRQRLTERGRSSLRPPLGSCLRILTMLMTREARPVSMMPRSGCTRPDQ